MATNVARSPLARTATRDRLNIRHLADIAGYWMASAGIYLTYGLLFSREQQISGECRRRARNLL